MSEKINHLYIYVSILTITNWTKILSVAYRDFGCESAQPPPNLPSNGWDCENGACCCGSECLTHKVELKKELGCSTG